MLQEECHRRANASPKLTLGAGSREPLLTLHSTHALPVLRPGDRAGEARALGPRHREDLTASFEAAPLAGPERLGGPSALRALCGGAGHASTALEQPRRGDLREHQRLSAPATDLRLLRRLGRGDRARPSHRAGRGRARGGQGGPTRARFSDRPGWIPCDLHGGRGAIRLGTRRGGRGKPAARKTPFAPSLPTARPFVALPPNKIRKRFQPRRTFPFRGLQGCQPTLAIR
jgi:hypothetical protein